MHVDEKYIRKHTYVVGIVRMYNDLLLKFDLCATVTLTVLQVI